MDRRVYLNYSSENPLVERNSYHTFVILFSLDGLPPQCDHSSMETLQSKTQKSSTYKEQTSVYHPRTQNKDAAGDDKSLKSTATHQCCLHQEGVFWSTTFPVTPLLKEELWRTLLVDLIKPSCKLDKSLLTKVSNSVLLETYGT